MRGAETSEPTYGPLGGVRLADGAALETTAFALGKPTPDTEALI
jgi:hypothetical protein